MIFAVIYSAGILLAKFDVILYASEVISNEILTHFDGLKLLMQEHGLKQTDLKEIRSQGVVSEILSGKRALNIEKIKEISNRFHVSPLVFI